MSREELKHHLQGLLDRREAMNERIRRRARESFEQEPQEPKDV